MVKGSNAFPLELVQLLVAAAVVEWRTTCSPAD